MADFEEIKKIHLEILGLFAGYGNDFKRITKAEHRDRILAKVQLVLKEAHKLYLGNKIKIKSLQSAADPKSMAEKSKLTRQNEQLETYQGYWFKALPPIYKEAYQRYAVA